MATSTTAPKSRWRSRRELPSSELRRCRPSARLALLGALDAHRVPRRTALARRLLRARRGFVVARRVRGAVVEAPRERRDRASAVARDVVGVRARGGGRRGLAIADARRPN